MVKFGFGFQAVLFLAIGFALGTTVAYAHASGREVGIAETLLNTSVLGLSEQKVL